MVPLRSRGPQPNFARVGRVRQFFHRCGRGLSRRPAPTCARLLIRAFGPALRLVVRPGRARSRGQMRRRDVSCGSDRLRPCESVNGLAWLTATYRGVVRPRQWNRRILDLRRSDISLRRVHGHELAFSVGGAAVQRAALPPDRPRGRAVGSHPPRTLWPRSDHWRVRIHRGLWPFGGNSWPVASLGRDPCAALLTPSLIPIALGVAIQVGRLSRWQTATLDRLARRTDPEETVSLAASPAQAATLVRLRRLLEKSRLPLRGLTDQPASA